MGGLGQRPLSEVSPMAQKRNSPIWNQTTKMPAVEAAAYDISPLNNTSAPRLFWKGRESPTPFAKGAENRMPYDPESSYFPARRPSLEDLKRASRVKNNASMFRDTEYDPANVNVPQRPMAADRSPNRDSQMNLAKSKFVDEDDAACIPRPISPSKDQPSPGKSSLSKGSRYAKGFDPSHDIWSEYDYAAYGKSVKFDAAPPQVNEYEMRTPDPSSLASGSRENSYDSEEDVDVSFEHESSIERDDSFDASLEDIEKTPVVLPEDWRFMSPESGNEEEDSFVENTDNDTSDERSVSRGGDSSSHSRVESLDSNGDRRPLPPLPSVARMSLSGSRPTSPEKLAAAFELGSGSQRGLPAAPRPASCSKSDINGGVSLEERLRLMMLQEQEGDGDGNDRETNEQSKASAKSQLEGLATQNDTKSAEPSRHDAFSPPRISRDSILRDIRKSESYDDDTFDDDSQIASSPNSYGHYDPDVPIPSLEKDDDDSSSVIIKAEAHDDDLYAIPDYYQNHSDNSLSSRDQRAKYDEDSNYSLREAAEATQKDNSGQATPIAEQHDEGVSEHQIEESKEIPQSDQGHTFDMASIRQSLGRPVTPEIKQEHEDELSEPSTPESVIRHPIEDDDDAVEEDEAAFESSSDESVPEPVATIKAPGAGLKTRPSLTPADLESMAATRRKISGQHAPPMPSLPRQSSTDIEREDKITDLPPQLTLPTNPSQRQSSLMQLDIPFSIQEESLGFGLDKEFDRVIESQKVAFQFALSQSDHSPVPASQADCPLASRTQGLPKFADFVRPANKLYIQQRGYLMRQNTKVVIANNRIDNDDEPMTPSEQSTQDLRGTRSAGSSPRKPSQQTWTTEPWNGSTRRPSIKMAGPVPKKKPVPGVGSVPPLPGQPSNVQEAQTTIDENEALAQDSFEEGEERGRLFVKVVGIKYLDLPLPRGERSHFALTLDNGLHCVTTSWLELGKSAPIGQEFELIVQNDLEFQLTLQMKVDEDKLYPQENAASPARQKTSALSRVFASPRRRKELDLKQQMQTQQSKDVNAPVYDRLRNLVARDGSFARAYVALSDHEKQAFGRPHIVDVACFNEWAVDEQPSSVKSKKSTTSMTAQRRPPYKIGKLELQLLFVPKPKGSKEDDMPKSMNACIREMRDAESVAARSWEGFLSQQGGDCPFWRRRFFKLQGTKLTAYHETTRQPRATINLAKASKLIDDRSSLTQKETSTKNGGRRKSAFAEEEDGYMFVEEGFRIRFGNGEVIDFYADSASDKDGWLRVMSEAVGKGSSSGNGAVKPWAELVLKRERSMKARRSTTDRLPVGPPSPTGKRQSNMTGAAPASAGSAAQAPSSPRPRHKHTQSQPEVGGFDARRQKTRSVMF